MQDGQLSLSAVTRIAPHVRRVDAPEIISRAEGKSTRELEDILAPLTPEPVKRDRVRTVGVETAGSDGVTPSVRRRVESNFQGSPELRDAIERAKDLLAHKFPFGEMEHVLYEVLEYYLATHDPQTTLRLAANAPVKGTSTIPATVRREVWARDGGRCSFVAADGMRCQTRRMLELDHRIPRARGGADTPENLRLLCRPHNDAERRRILGEGQLSPNWSRDQSVDKSPGLFD